MSSLTIASSLDPALAWGMSVVLQVTLMAATALGLAGCFRRHSAIRYWLCCGGLGLTLHCPATVLLLQHADIGLLAVSLTADAVAADTAVNAHRASELRASPSAPLGTSDARGQADCTQPLAARSATDDRSIARDEHRENTRSLAPRNTAAPGRNDDASSTGALSSDRAGADERVSGMSLLASVFRVVGAWLLLVWLAGAAMQLVRLIIGWKLVVRLVESAAEADDAYLSAAFARACHSLGLRPGRIRLKTSPRITVPIAVGCLRPLVVLPERLSEQIAPQQLDEILLHEVAHILRRDQSVVLFQNVAGALYWFHPLVRWLNRGLAQAREEVCDNYVLAAGDATSYSRTLLRIAELAGSARALPGTVGLFASRWKLEQRISGLLDGNRNRMTRLTLAGRSLAALSTLVVCSASLATIRLAAAQTTAPPQAARGQNAAQAAAVKPHASPDGDPKLIAKEAMTQFELQVVGPDGGPVPHADIKIRPKAEPSWIIGGTFERQTNYDTIVKATQDGTLVLNLPRKENPSLFVQMDGFGPYHAGWGSESRPPKFTIELEAARAVGGLVVDENNLPIQGAIVRPSIYFKQGGSDTSALLVGTKITTDENGRWQYKSLPKSLKTFGVEVSHPSFMPTRPSLSPELFDLADGQRDAARIVMKRGLTVRGKVTDAQGKPVVGALVRTKFLNDIREAKTNDAGVYELVGCEPSVTRIVVSASGLATDMQTVTISEEPPEPVDFVMQPGGHVRIRVIDQNNQPIAKTRIFFQHWREGRYEYFELDHAPQQTDANGVWEWNEAPLDEFQADICPPNQMQLAEQTLLARAEEYVFSPPPTLVVVGRVIDADTKQPIPNFQVVPGVRSGPEHMNWVPYNIFEGRDGRFEQRITHDYFAHLFKVQAQGYLPVASRDIKSNEGRVEVTFELERGKDIDMLVATSDGRPATGAKIALGIAGAQIDVNNGDIDDGSTYAQRTVTGNDGRFRFPAQATPYQLVITHEAGFAHVKSEAIEDADRVELTPWAMAAGVFRVAGQPIGGVTLYLQSGNMRSYGPEQPSIFTSSYVVTGKDGQFALERVFPGEGSIQRHILKIGGEGAKEITSSTLLKTDFYPGETTQIDFEGTGSRVVGNLRAPGDAQQKVIWAFADVQVRSHIALPPLPPPPAKVKEPLDRTKPEVKAWFELQELHRRAQRMEQQYTATVDPTGKFVIDDVAPGEYILSVRCWERPGMGSIDNLEFKVSKADAENRREVDLGRLQLK